MKIKKVLQILEKKLQNKKIESARAEAEILLSQTLRKNREFLYTYPEQRLNFWQKLKLNSFLAKRLSGTPLAYILGHKQFYGLDFIVNKNVLTPRPETELMVDEVLKVIKNCEFPSRTDPPGAEKIKNIVDVGTGSGCMIISIVKNLNNNDINYWGLDISRRALRVARQNAEKNGLNDCIHFLYSDLLNSIDKKIFSEPVIIVANLPYLTMSQAKDSLTIQKEPKIALLGGSDGFDCYRWLFNQIKKYSGVIKGKVLILCEIDEIQKTGMGKLIIQELPKAEFKIINDLNGFARLAIIKI